MKSEDFKHFYIDAETRVDLVFKQRLKILMEQRLSGSKKSLPFVPIKEKEALFDGDPTQLEGDFDSFDANWFRVDGPCDMMDQMYMKRSELSFDCISHIFYLYSYEYEDDGMESITDEQLSAELMLDEGDKDSAETLERARDFIDGYNKARKGNIEGALCHENFNNFCLDFSNLYFSYDLFDETLIAKQAEYFMFPFLEGSESYGAKCGYYYSDEVYLYDKYRELLPDNLREQADGYVKIFNEPMDDSIYFDHEGYRFVIYKVGQPNDIIVGMEDKSFNVLFEHSVRWLDENLPSMREHFYEESASTDEVQMVA